MSIAHGGGMAEQRTGFSPIRSGSVRAQVRETLQASMFSGQLRPGDALREAHLARDFGVSQATVREALIELEHQGMVVRKPNKETTVTRMSPEEIAERGQLRAALESMAGIQASRKLTENDFTLLNRRLGELETARAANDYLGFSVADLDFHRAIWGLSGNRTLYRTLEQLTVPLIAFLSILRSRRYQNISPRPHEPIVMALRSQDEAAIRAAFEEHIMSSYQQLAQPWIEPKSPH